MERNIPTVNVDLVLLFLFVLCLNNAIWIVKKITKSITWNLLAIKRRIAEKISKKVDPYGDILPSKQFWHNLSIVIVN